MKGEENMKKFLSILVLAALVLALCGARLEDGSVDLEAVLAEFNLGEEMLVLDAYDIADLYFIDYEDLKQVAAAVHTSGINCDEIIMIEAVDADAAAYIKDIMDARYESKLNETENYLPDEYAIIKQCSVIADGNYVAMIVAPNAADLVAIYNASFEE